jgi:hypothetical protein
VTIATCYVSPEGVVLGADSTSTVGTPGNFHYFNYAHCQHRKGARRPCRPRKPTSGNFSAKPSRTSLLSASGRSSPNLSRKPIARYDCDFYWPAANLREARELHCFDGAGDTRVREVDRISNRQHRLRQRVLRKQCIEVGERTGPVARRQYSGPQLVITTSNEAQYHIGGAPESHAVL